MSFCQTPQADCRGRCRPSADVCSLLSSRHRQGPGAIVAERLALLVSKLCADDMKGIAIICLRERVTRGGPGAAGLRLIGRQHASGSVSPSHCKLFRSSESFWQLFVWILSFTSSLETAATFCAVPSFRAWVRARVRIYGCVRMCVCVCACVRVCPQVNVCCFNYIVITCVHICVYINI